MTVKLIACFYSVALYLIWGIGSFFKKDKEDANACMTRASIYGATTLIIIALPD